MAFHRFLLIFFEGHDQWITIISPPLVTTALFELLCSLFCCCSQPSCFGTGTILIQCPSAFAFIDCSFIRSFVRCSPSIYFRLRNPPTRLEAESLWLTYQPAIAKKELWAVVAQKGVKNLENLGPCLVSFQIINTSFKKFKASKLFLWVGTISTKLFSNTGKIFSPGKDIILICNNLVL